MVNRQRSRRPRAPARIRRILHRADTGFKLIPRADPPELVVVPWWPLTVRLQIPDASKSTSLTPAAIHAGIIAQLGISLTTAFTMRVLSIRVWGLKSQPITMVVADTLGDASRWKHFSDVGSPINYSRLGWRFGVVSSIQSHLPASTVVLATITGAAGPATVYVQILLKSNSTAGVSSLSSGCESDPQACGCGSRLPCLDSMAL